MARLREEPESDDGSSPDEGVPDKFVCYRAIDELMKVGVGNTQREICDGQSLAPPGRWILKVPLSAHWKHVSDLHRRFTEHYGTEELLVPWQREKSTSGLDRRAQAGHHQGGCSQWFSVGEEIR